MEPLSSFYQTRLMGRLITDEKSKNIEPHTLTIKFGISENVPKRGIRAEFLSYANAATKKNPSLGKYEVTDEIHMLSVDGKQSCCVAPKSLIGDWESFVNTRFYDKSPRLFQDAGTKGSKHEYLETPQETEERSKYLIKVITKFAPKFAELKPLYEELTDSSTALCAKIYAEYKAIFDVMKKQLNNYGLKKQRGLTVVKPAAVPSTQSAPANGVAVNIFTTLESDWTLCVFKGTTIYGLQHNTYHSDGKGNLKDPDKDFNILLADLSEKNSRFQFHSNSFLNSKYTPYNANTVRVVDILTKAGKVRYFDASQLPPKGKKMLLAPAITDGAKGNSPVTFTNI